jgi:apolipoprotein D and lipocalin family protein
VASPLVTHPVEAVPWLDLDRYLGRWHAVAWLPSPFQRRYAVELMLEYAPRADGLIDVHSACRDEDGRPSEVHGIARQPEPLREPARLQLRLAPVWLGRLQLAWHEHWVIGLDRDYRWAMVGQPRRRQLWILSREARMDYDALEDLKATAQGMGYDLASLRAACHRSD